jgi:hypothetical protein
MGIALGTEVYRVDHLRVIARGKAHSVLERDDALDRNVRALIEDHAGLDRAKLLTDGLNLTGFQTANLSAVLNGGSVPKDWEVGESYAEAYLAEHHQCHFPWSDRWDERKDKSSLPGCDLVGFNETFDATTNSYRFVFAEVKTSKEKKYPPGAMHRRGGLKQQIEDLKDNVEIRRTLARYIMMRARKADWLDKFEIAMSRFLEDTSDVAVYGILVRDVPPDSSDLEAPARKLGTSHPSAMHVELLAIYLPSGSITHFGTKYAKIKTPIPGVRKSPSSSDASRKSAPVNKQPIKKAPKKNGGT